MQCRRYEERAKGDDGEYTGGREPTILDDLERDANDHQHHHHSVGAGNYICQNQLENKYIILYTMLFGRLKYVIYHH